MDNKLSSSGSSGGVGSQGLRLAVFDCDGTIVDSVKSIITCMQAACAANGVAAPPADEIRAIVGLPLKQAITLLCPGIDRRQVMAVREGYRDHFGGLREKGKIHEPLYDGSLDAMAELQAAGWLLGVATGKSMKGLVATLDGHAIGYRFTTLQTADICRGKPDPDMLHRAMAETGARAGATVMIGDTTFDMEMARNAGVMAVGVAWGYHEVGELKRSGAHRIVDDYGRLAHVVEELYRAGP